MKQRDRIGLLASGILVLVVAALLLLVSWLALVPATFPIPMNMDERQAGAGGVISLELGIGTALLSAWLFHKATKNEKQP